MINLALKYEEKMSELPNLGPESCNAGLDSIFVFICTLESGRQSPESGLDINYDFTILLRYN